MATRGVQQLGTAEEGTTITITANSVQVYSGPAGTAGILAEFTIDNDNAVQTTVAYTVSVTAGAGKVGELNYNYIIGPNPSLTAEEMDYLPVMSDNPKNVPLAIRQSVYDKGGWYVSTANTWGNPLSHNGDSRSSIMIDGVLQTPENNPDPAEQWTPIDGWGFYVASGSSIIFNGAIPAAQPSPAPIQPT